MLSIIIITYNSGEKIKKVLSAFKSKSNCEVIIVDNSSTDDTVVQIRKYSCIEIIQNQENVGFARAASQGARAARGKYLLFINPDTSFDFSALGLFSDKRLNNKKIAVWGCKTVNADGSTQYSCGSFPAISNIIADRIPLVNKIIRTELLRQEKYYEEKQEPDWVSGAFFLVRRDVFLKLGGFDEKYFMYGEDVDFCYRAKMAGYKIIYDPSFEIVHYDMGKSEARKRNKAINMRKGFAIFFRKYKSPFYCFIWETILKVESFFRPSLKSN